MALVARSTDSVPFWIFGTTKDFPVSFLALIFFSIWLSVCLLSFNEVYVFGKLFFFTVSPRSENCRLIEAHRHSKVANLGSWSPWTPPTLYLIRKSARSSSVFETSINWQMWSISWNYCESNFHSKSVNVKVTRKNVDPKVNSKYF